MRTESVMTTSSATVFKQLRFYWTARCRRRESACPCPPRRWTGRPTLRSSGSSPPCSASRSPRCPSPRGPGRGTRLVLSFRSCQVCLCQVLSFINPLLPRVTSIFFLANQISNDFDDCAFHSLVPCNRQYFGGCRSSLLLGLWGYILLLVKK